MKSLLYFIVVALCMAFVIPNKRNIPLVYSEYYPTQREAFIVEKSDIKKRAEQHSKTIDSIIEMVEKNNAFIKHNTNSRHTN